MSSPRGRGRGRGGGWGREEGRHNDQEQPRPAHHRSSNDVRSMQRGEWGSQQAGTSMQQLHLQPRPMQQQPVMLATSRGVQHVRQPQQQQQGGTDHYHNGRQYNRYRNWNGGNSQNQPQRNQQHGQHHHQSGQQSRQGQQVLQPHQQQQRQSHQQVQQQNQRQAQQIQQRNEAVLQQKGKRRRQTSGFYQGRAAEQHGAGAAAAAASDDLPGFTRCPQTGNYYRITADSSGLVGHRVSDVRAAERKKREEEEAKKKKEEEEEQRKKLASTRRPLSTLSLLSSLSLGRLAGPALPRAAAAMRMQQLPSTPTQVIDVTDFLPLDPFSGMHSVAGCEFLDVSADGETLSGCWAFAGTCGSRTASMACSLVTNVAKRGEGRMGEQQWLGLGPLRGVPVRVRASAIVDMAMAPFDRDVTCLLYTTATSTLDKTGRPITVCDVSTRPVCCRIDDWSVSQCALYNVQTRLGGNVYSCAWSQKHMKIGVGMERHGTIIDLMSGDKQKVETRGKMAITQSFDESGDTLFLGLRSVDSCIMDTRTAMTTPVAVIPESRNTGWMRLLQKSGPQVVLSTLEGKLSLYDIRRPCVSLRSFDGHRSANGVRLPSFVDNDEQFLFAVGADFATRVWSLSSGTLLHELAAPAAATSLPRPSDYPRPVFSRSWAGMQGQDALLVAAGSHINVYRLGEQME